MDYYIDGALWPKWAKLDIKILGKVGYCGTGAKKKWKLESVEDKILCLSEKILPSEVLVSGIIFRMLAQKQRLALIFISKREN